jgi:DNA-binding CsgD family transcriptional regulator
VEPTKIQLEILIRAASGMTREEIARDLGYSPWYVKDLFAEARSTLGARNITHAITICLARGYLCVDGRAESLFKPDPIALAV